MVQKTIEKETFFETLDIIGNGGESPNSDEQLVSLIKDCDTIIYHPLSDESVDVVFYTEEQAVMGKWNDATNILTINKD